MTDNRDSFRKRAENKADSLCLTYKQHFTAANFYRTLSRFLDVVIFGSASMILADSFWNVLPSGYILIPPIIIAAITGYRRGTRIEDRAENFRRSAKQYHALFDEFRDFLHITLEVDDMETVRSEFNRLSDERRNLNASTPDAGEIWYRYVKMKGEDRIKEEISTTPETRGVL